MANHSKEYEMIFLLKAQMDASMKNFSLVGGQLKVLEEQVQKYQNTLKDIEGYRRQEQGIQTLTEKQQALEAKTDEVNEALNKATKAHQAAAEKVKEHSDEIEKLRAKKEANGKLTDEQKKKLEEERLALKNSKEALSQAAAEERKALEAKNAHQKSIDATRVALAKQQEALKQVIQSLQQAGVDTKNLEAEEQRLSAALDEAAAKEKKWADFGNTITGLSNQFTTLSMAANMANQALMPVLGFYKKSLDSAAALEYGMSAVEAVSGATAAQKEKMTAVVKEMGATTIYTAQESATAMQNMALAGWSAEQMIAGLPAVIKMAAASGEDLAEMTSIVSDGMNAFQLSGEQAAVKFADVLAKAATSSNTNVSLLGDSLSYVETTAGNMGYKIEDVALALAAMANNSLKGGVSGSALNTMLTRMSGANEVAAKQMDEMNLSMYDAAGRAKDMKTFLDELRAAFKDFGDDAQSAQIAAYKLAGMRGMRGLLAIVGQSDEQWQRLSEDVYNFQGASEQISSIRMDNYTGQVYLLTSAWDALKTSVGEQFLPAATEAAGLLTDMTNGANEFVQENGSFVVGVGASAAALVGLNSALLLAAGGVKMFSFAVSTLKLGSLLGVGGTFAAIAGIAGVAGVAAMTFNERLKLGIPTVKELTERTRALEEAANGAADACGKSAEEVEASAAVARRYIDRLEEMGDYTRLNAGEQEAYHEILEKLTYTVPELADSIDLANNRIEGGTDALRENTDAWEENAKAQAYQEKLVELYQKKVDAEIEQQKNEMLLADAVEAKTAAEKEYQDALKNAGLDKPAATFSDVPRGTPQAIQELEQKYRAAQLTVENYEKAVTEAEETLGLTEDQEKAILTILEKMPGAYKDAQAAIEAQTRAKMDELGLSDKYLDQLAATEEALDGVKAAYDEAYAAAYESLSGIFGLFEEAEDPAATTMTNLQAALDSQLDYFTKFQENLSALKQAADVNGIDLTVVWGALSDGSSEAAAAVSAMAQSVSGGDLDGLKQYLETYDALVKKQEETADLAAAGGKDVAAAIDQAGEEMKKSWEDTEASNEAREAIEMTIDAAIEELEASAPRLSTAIAAQGSIWKSQFAAALGQQSFAASMSNWSAATMNRGGGAGSVLLAAEKKYASGTMSAAKGAAIVGEDGPELLFMNGGERIIDANHTRQIIEDGGTSMDLNLNFNISGSATPETVREAAKLGDNIEKRVENVLRRMGIDARRRGYR